MVAARGLSGDGRAWQLQTGLPWLCVTREQAAGTGWLWIQGFVSCCCFRGEKWWQVCSLLVEFGEGKVGGAGEGGSGTGAASADVLPGG